MNKSRSNDSHSVAAWIGRVLCFVLPVPLLAVGWPVVVLLLLYYHPSEWYTTTFSEYEMLTTLYCMMVVGTLMGIQISADIDRRWEFTTRRHSSWQFTILSACSVAVIVVIDCLLLPDLKKGTSLEKLCALYYICLVQLPAIAWFTVNVMRFTKSR